MLWPSISCLIDGTQSCAIHRFSSYVYRVRPLYIRPIHPCQQSFLSEMAYLMSPFQRPCIFRAGRIDVNVKGCSSWRQVRRGCMFSAERSVLWCPLVGAESDFCGRNGRWKGLIFRHNRVHVQNQGAVLKKCSLRGVHPGDFPSRQGENERRPISCAHSSWIKRSSLIYRKITRVHPVVSFPLKVTTISITTVKLSKQKAQST